MLFRPDREGEKLRTPAEPESGSRLTWMTEESPLSGQVSVSSMSRTVRHSPLSGCNECAGIPAN